MRTMILLCCIALMATGVYAQSCISESDNTLLTGTLNVYKQALEPGFVTIKHANSQPDDAVMKDYYLFDTCKDSSTIVEYRCVNGKVEQTELACKSSCLKKGVRVNNVHGAPAFWKYGVGRCAVVDPSDDGITTMLPVRWSYTQNPTTGTINFDVIQQRKDVSLQLEYGFKRTGQVINRIPISGSQIAVGRNFALSKDVEYFFRLVEKKSGKVVPGGEQIIIKSQVQSQIRGSAKTPTGNVVALPHISHNGHLIFS
jgi:hypothetical protein